jgi:hypothetical protein
MGSETGFQAMVTLLWANRLLVVRLKKTARHTVLRANFCKSNFILQVSVHPHVAATGSFPGNPRRSLGFGGTETAET